jgi:hypothetical protein
MINIRLISDPNCKDFIEGINILQKYVPTNLCVNSNELVYWIENYNQLFNDIMCVWIIKDEYKVIGYFQTTNFINKFMFIDYLIIEKEYRTKSNMQQIYNIIKPLLINKNIVIECGKEMNQHDAIIRLYESFGFKQFDINYKEPKLNVDVINKNMSWSEEESILMYKGNDLIPIDVIQTIYFNHYLRWYSLYKMDYSQYIKFLCELIIKTKK